MSIFSFGKKINLKNPKTLNEKINYLKFYDNDPLKAICSDKVRVRDFVSNKGLDKILNEIYGVYDNVNEINFDELPNEYVIKCNFGCGNN